MGLCGLVGIASQIQKIVNEPLIPVTKQNAPSFPNQNDDAIFLKLSSETTISNLNFLIFTFFEKIFASALK